MTQHRGSILLVACVGIVACITTPVSAFWKVSGSGSGSAAVTAVPAANQPAASVASRSVTIAWTQSSVLGRVLGSFTGGGYAVTRYADGGSTPITPGTACDTTISGTAATLQCVEAGVPYGAWAYAITPVLNSFTGTQSARSVSVAVTTAAPVIGTVSSQNPGAGQSTGDIDVGWAAVTGATGFNVYRHAGSGSYDFASPLNGSTPLSAATTMYADSGSGLAQTTSYHYVVRAIAGSPAVESPSSNDLSATTISRPAAPAGSVTATAAAGARIDVGWSAVAGVTGYNVYRKVNGGAYNFTVPLNGTTPLAATTYADMTAVDASTYVYTVRSVILGAGSAQVESASSADSAPVVADASPPAPPATVTVTSGGNVVATNPCSVAVGTRFVNNAGKGSVGITATIATPETGETVVFSATSTGSTPVTTTVPATTTSVATTLNLGTLFDGTVTVTARTMDMATNPSATRSPANLVVKDVVAPTAPTATYHLLALLTWDISGVTECGATINAQRNSGGAVYTTTAASNGTYDVANVGLLVIGLDHFNVTSTDLAGNVSTATTTS